MKQLKRLILRSQFSFDFRIPLDFPRHLGQQGWEPMDVKNQEVIEVLEDGMCKEINYVVPVRICNIM